MPTCPEPSWRYAHAQNTTLIASLCASFALVAIVLQTFDGSNAAVSLAMFVTLLSGLTAVWRFRQHGIEPLAMFCFAFSLYDGLLLFRLATIGDDSVLVYPTTFSGDTYAAAGVLCAIAATSVLGTALFCDGIAKQRPSSRPPRPRCASTGWFCSGLSMYAVGVVLYYLQFQQFGGYFVSLAMDRGERFELAGSEGALSYPYLAFVVPGIACLCYAAESGRSRIQRITCYALTAVWCTLVLLQGDRRLLLQAFLTVTGVLSVVKPKSLELKTRTWVLMAAAYLAFASFGYARSTIYMVASGQETTNGAIDQLSSDWSSKWITPERSEFAGPYLSLLSAVSQSTRHLYGSSYYESFLTVLPRFLYPGQKPELLTHEFDEEVHRGGGVVSGWGYNPVAEAYLNFGSVGVALAFVLWTLFFLAVGSMRHRSTLGTLVSAVLLSEAVNANRIDFRNVYGETVYLGAGVLIAAGLATTINKIWSKPRRHIANSI
jgi:oligosaccharide repeat unit polymerase